MTPQPSTRRVITVGPMPAEKCAYALARYSRSPDSIADSLAWVRTHDSAKFLESFYFQYGHASIADLGHVVLCFEGVSELAATELEDEQLWDGQARSTRYQNFFESGYVTPSDLTPEQTALFERTADQLLAAYRDIHQAMRALLEERLPRPDQMKPEAYQRNLSARAFDVARYLLFFGIKTGVGQVTSIRSLERQIRRIRASEYAELRDLGEEAAHACAALPHCQWTSDSQEPVAPTLAKYVEPDSHLQTQRDDLRLWAQQNLAPFPQESQRVTISRAAPLLLDVAATLLFPVVTASYAALVDSLSSRSDAVLKEIIDVALRSKPDREELGRAFRNQPYAVDLLIDLGAYRDLHRHRRCQQFRQEYRGAHGDEVPSAIAATALEAPFRKALQSASEARRHLPTEAAAYLLPLAARHRFLFKMDFAQVQYMAKLRSGVKGHFSYRQIAWEMKCAMELLEPSLAHLLEATPPSIEDPLTR